MAHRICFWAVGAVIAAVAFLQPAYVIGAPEAEAEHLSGAAVVMGAADGVQMHWGGGGHGGEAHLRELPTLQRMVRHFDFEEATLAPYEMPLNFYRLGGEEGAAAQGFPPFGTMRLSDEVAYSGAWSFAFSLDGGSLAARVPSAVLPVVPLADYAISARVRTEGLKRARARLVGWFYDEHGDVIEASRTASELIETGGTWQVHTIVIRGDFEQAVDLGIELQVLQPRQFVGRVNDASLLLDDVTGKAWFDDVTIWHLPRIEVGSAHPGNAIVAGAYGQHVEAGSAGLEVQGAPDDAREVQLWASTGADVPGLTVLVRDLAHEELMARLRIFDILGGCVFDERFAAPRMPWPRTLALPTLPYGWYRAVIELSSAEQPGDIIAMQWVDFALLGAQRRPASFPGGRFGVVLGDDWKDHVEGLPEMIGQVGAANVALPMWTGRFGGMLPPEKLKAVQHAVSQLMAEGTHLTMVLGQVPRDLAELLDVRRDDVLGALAQYGGQMSAWRDAAAELSTIGTEMHCWQLGQVTDRHLEEAEQLQQLVDEATYSVRRLAPGPMVAVGMLAEQMIGRELAVAARWMYVSHELAPEAIGQYAELWREDGSPFAVKLELPPVQGEGPYTQQDRAVDLFHRALHAVRAGAEAVYIDVPWTFDEQGRCSIDSTYVVWRQLADHLRNRRFAGEIDLGLTRRCWLFEGDKEGDDMLIAWSDAADGDVLAMQLADGAVTVVDMYGNVRQVQLEGSGTGRHHIELGRMPVFIEGVHLPLVKFRSGFAVVERFIPAENRVHERELVLRNPWDQPISGTLVVAEKPQWSIVPQVHDFAIEPGDEVRLPVEVTFDRSIVAGETMIEAEAVLRVDGLYQVGLSAPVHVGLRHLDFSATWRVVTNAETGRDDLVITQYIVNTAPPGREPAYADAIVMAPGVRQERRLIAGLEPGQMTIRMFQIPDGASLLAGQTVRVSLADRDRFGRLNREIRIPAVLK